MPLTAIATTPQAVATLEVLCAGTPISLWKPETGDLTTYLPQLWRRERALIFALATGAVVRLIAPLLENKMTDPAVVVIDSAGKFVISLCGGHAQGADKLTQILAQKLQATPILTGAAAAAKLPGIDTLGIPFGWRRGTGDWTGVSSVMARGGKIQVIQEVGSTLWQDNLPENHPFDFTTDMGEARLWISFTQRRFAPDTAMPKVQWHPRILWVGIGCEKHTPQELISEAVTQVFRSHHLALEAIAGLATIDLKAEEKGLVDFAQKHNLPLVTFTASELAQVSVPNPSDIVYKTVSTPSVAEASALLAAEQSTLLITKQVLKRVTVAIALASREYTGRQGRLYLVGIGPGAISQMTGAAQGAITAADVVIGYKLYTDLVQPLLRPGQILESLPITQEKERAMRAISLAQWGLTVAVISSGDAGIYGMAGLVLAELGSQPIPVETFPGVSALQAAAARVGAPLMHDFCAISLSDLLTPWAVIEGRLIAAAQADFVTVIYNPRSQNRTQQIVKAHTIFCTYRQPTTPVAIVRAAYRQDEQIHLTTLENMLKFSIDMLTTVIIGNNSTYLEQERLITPRGYSH